MTALLKVAWLCGATALFVYWAGALFRLRPVACRTPERARPDTAQRLLWLTPALLALDMLGLALWPAGPG